MGTFAIVKGEECRGCLFFYHYPLPFAAAFRFDFTKSKNGNGGNEMATINLRDYFFCYKLDCFVEVSDEDVEVFLAGLTIKWADVYFKAQREENAYQRRLYRHDAHYSLDCNDGIENDVINQTADPLKKYIDSFEKELLYDAIASLPENQAKRVYAYFFLGLSKQDIAHSEGVSKQCICQSIERALANIEKYLKNILEGC